MSGGTLSPRLEEVFREEARRALGVERMTAEQLIRTILDFPATAPPDEVALLAYFLLGIASKTDEATPPAAPGEATP